MPDNPIDDEADLDAYVAQAVATPAGAEVSDDEADLDDFVAQASGKPSLAASKSLGLPHVDLGSNSIGAIDAQNKARDAEARRPRKGIAESVGFGMRNTSTAGAGDELAALLPTPESMPEELGGYSADAQSMRVEPTVDERVDEEREQERQAAKDNPAAYTTGQVLGAGALGALLPVGGATMAARAAVQGVQGVGQAAAQRFGDAQGDATDRLAETTEDVAEHPWYYSLAGAVPAAAHGVAAGARGLGNIARREAHFSRGAAILPPADRVKYAQNKGGRAGIEKLGQDIEKYKLHDKPWYRSLTGATANDMLENSTALKSRAGEGMGQFEPEIRASGVEVPTKNIVDDLRTSAEKARGRSHQAGDIEGAYRDKYADRIVDKTSVRAQGPVVHDTSAADDWAAKAKLAEDELLNAQSAYDEATRVAANPPLTKQIGPMPMTGHAEQAAWDEAQQLAADKLAKAQARYDEAVKIAQEPTRPTDWMDFLQGKTEAPPNAQTSAAPVTPAQYYKAQETVKAPRPQAPTDVPVTSQRHKRALETAAQPRPDLYVEPRPDVPVPASQWKQHNDARLAVQQPRPQAPTDVPPVNAAHRQALETIQQPQPAPVPGAPPKVYTGTSPVGDVIDEIRYGDEQIDHLKLGGIDNAGMKGKTDRRVAAQMRNNLSTSLIDAGAKGEIDPNTVKQWEAWKKAYSTASAVEDPALVQTMREYNGKLGLSDVLDVVNPAKTPVQRGNLRAGMFHKTANTLHTGAAVTDRPARGVGGMISADEPKASDPEVKEKNSALSTIINAPGKAWNWVSQLVGD